MKENIIREKSFEFACKIVYFYKHIVSEAHEFVLAKQLLRSGTSIGANVNEAVEAQSKPDFIHKMSIALKEARETMYWINLITLTEKTIDTKQVKSDLNEILSLLTAIIKTSKASEEK